MREIAGKEETWLKYHLLISIIGNMLGDML